MAPATPATPTRNTTVPAANRNPKNRTSKRIIDPLCSVQTRRQTKAARSLFVAKSYQVHSAHYTFCCGGIISHSERLIRISIRPAAVAKLGLAARPVRFARSRCQSFCQKHVDGLSHRPDCLRSPAFGKQMIE